jgi:microcystin-dependent protein
MADPFVAEVRIFGFNFAPKGWAFCAGQILPISQNTALFSLLGTTYGGDGKSTFALPNVQGSAVVGAGQGQGLSERFEGEEGGEQAVTLLQSEIPVHSHSLKASFDVGTENKPDGNYLAQGQGIRLYDANNQPQTTMAPQMASPAGGSFPHNNTMRSLALNYCIALQGVFPPRS